MSSQFSSWSSSSGYKFTFSYGNSQYIGNDVNSILSKMNSSFYKLISSHFKLEFVLLYLCTLLIRIIVPSQYYLSLGYGNQNRIVRYVENQDFSLDYDETESQSYSKSKVEVPERRINNDYYGQQNYNNNNYSNWFYQPNYNYGNRSSKQPYQRKYSNYNNGYLVGNNGYALEGRNRQKWNGYQGRNNGYALVGRNHQTKNYSSARSIRCFTCGETFTNYTKLHAHRSEAHSKRNYYCPVCNKEFSTLKNMKEHEKTHTIQACQECPEVFKLKDSLLAHTEHAHPKPSTTEGSVDKFGIGNFTSPVASSTPAVSFTSSQDSGVNVKLESHACSLCIKSFDSEEKLKSHAKIHTEPQQETPQETQPSLSESQPSDVFSCPFCIKKWSTRRELTLHLESAHTRVFYCRKCPAEYSTQVELDAHSKVHT